MTLREGVSLSPGESVPTVPADEQTLAHQKARRARERRRKLKSSPNTCNSTGGTTAGTCTDDNDVVSRFRNANVNDDHKASSSPTRGLHGVVSVMGRRREMEDAVSVHLDNTIMSYDNNNNNERYEYYAVYDGHGGSYVAEACKESMHVMLNEEVVACGGGGIGGRSDTWWEGVMGRCFERMDREVYIGGGERMELDNGGQEMEEMTVGSTVVMAVVGRDEVVVANCGDSRAVLCRDGVAVPLSFDHKPDRPDELARIEAAGGRVINWNGHRVLGVLATSRSIGDHYLKPYVSSVPEVIVTKRTEGDEFLILASDGLWDVISNEMACQVVRRCLTGKIQRKFPNLTNGETLGTSSKAGVAAALLAELAIAKGSKDNISVIVVELRRHRRHRRS